MPFSLYSPLTIVHVEPTGLFKNNIGDGVALTPILWWSIISTISHSSAPVTACESSLWSTSTSFCTRADINSAGDNIPRGLFCESHTYIVLPEYSLARADIFEIKKSSGTTATSFRISGNARVAILTSSAVVALSYLHISTLTPLLCAISTTDWSIP